MEMWARTATWVCAIGCIASYATAVGAAEIAVQQYSAPWGWLAGGLFALCLVLLALNRFFANRGW